MNTKTTITLTEARKRIFNIVEEIQSPGIHYTFTEKGQPKAVLLSAEEFESWAETLEVMKDFPDLKKDIAQAHKEYKAGKFITLKDYALRSRPTQKSSKRTK